MKAPQRLPEPWWPCPLPGLGAGLGDSVVFRHQPQGVLREPWRVPGDPLVALGVSPSSERILENKPFSFESGLEEEPRLPTASVLVSIHPPGAPLCPTEPAFYLGSSSW